LERSLNDSVNKKVTYLYVSWKNREKRLLNLSCLSVRLSARTKQLGSHWTDLREILYWVFF